jgi:hypothetical protein
MTVLRLLLVNISVSLTYLIEPKIISSLVKKSERPVSS